MKTNKLIETRYIIKADIMGKDGNYSYNVFDTLKEARDQAEKCTFNVFTIKRIDTFKTVFGNIKIEKNIICKC